MVGMQVEEAEQFNAPVCNLQETSGVLLHILFSSCLLIFNTPIGFLFLFSYFIIKMGTVLLANHKHVFMLL